MKSLIAPGLVFLLMISTNVPGAGKQPKAEILGISLGMDVKAAHSRLQKIGRLEKEERKQQEVWFLKDDPNFAYLIIGFDSDYKKVRYVTVKARDAGRGVRYSDVLDIKRAREIKAANNLEYVQQVTAQGDRPAYLVIARGTDPKYLRYYSIKKVGETGGDPDEPDKK